MAECGNMPDWQHPYHTPQAGRTSAPTGAQNASTGHMFVSSMSPPALDGMNLSAESRHQSTKHQSEPSGFVGRNYQPGGGIAVSNCPTSSSLSSGVHMTPLTGCVSHYGATSARNAMMESLGSSMDPRMAPVSGIAEEVAHRNSQIQAFPGATNHPNPSSSINVNAGNPIHGSTMVPQNSPVGSMSPGRQGPSFGACKAPCCNPDPNIPYQHWEKYGHYHGPTSANVYRENIRQTGYPIDNRRFMPEINLRKDCLEGKELEVPPPFPVEHRRNFPDYKYRKDNVLPRNYPNNGNNLMQNYPMQNYNFPNDYQKCPYSVKDYMRRGNNGGAINSKNSSIFKYQEQQSVIAQQKYAQHSKQMQYQNGSAMPSGLQNTATSGSIQNSYYNGGQMPRDLARDYSREYQQEQSVVTNRMAQPPNSHVHGSSFQKYHQVYHQKIAMQRYSVENHLRAFSRIPGYQSHPKYQECVMRYRELLRLQQTVDYPNVLQEAPKIPSPSNPAAVAPINLQFDQNGILINSNYIPAGYSGIHATANPTAASTESPVDSSGNGRMSGAANLEAGNQFVDHTETCVNVTRDLDNNRLQHQSAVTTMHENPERYFMPGEKNSDAGRYEKNERGTAGENLNSISVDETASGREQQREGDTCSRIAAGNETTAASDTIEYKNCKDFADKPELDVRQFLANWDESEDEDTEAASMPGVSLSDSNAEHFEETVFSGKSDENCTHQANSNQEINSTVTVEPESMVLTCENVKSAENGSETMTITSQDSGNNGGRNQCEVTEKGMRCIRTDDGTDDIPTIHIVDSLEVTSEMEKMHTVFGSLASAVLNPISIVEGSPESVTKGETIVLFEQDDHGLSAKTLEFSVTPEGNSSEIVEGVVTSIIDSTSGENTTIVDTTEEGTYKSSESCENCAGNDQERMTTSSGPSYTATDTVASSSCSGKSNSEDSTNLPKQNSFTSDESHNPDDISLPDLQTSECTPISTTLNTPIHSDSEESSEHVSDLTISTNPIEIIQNSPIISFTHSPIKIEPYEQLNDARMARRNSQREHEHSLDFDFDGEVARRENEKYNETTEASEASVVEALEAGEGNSGESVLLEEIREPSELYNEDKNRTENERDGEYYPTADPLVGMAHISKSKEQPEGSTGAPSSENINSESAVERILTSDQLNTEKSPRILEREDDFNRSEDLEELCDMSLDGSCMIPLIPGGEEDCDEPRMPVPPMDGNCLTKILNDTLPIRDLDVLETSDEEKLDEPDDDMWVEVRYMDFQENSPEKTKIVRKAGRTGKIKQEKSSATKLKHHSEKIIDDTSVEMLGTSAVEGRTSNPEAEKEAPSPENSQRDKTNASSSAVLEGSSGKSRIFGRRETNRVLEDESPSAAAAAAAAAVAVKDAKNTITKSFLTKCHRDSNVEIQVANLNLKIHDNEVMRNDCNLVKSKNQESAAGESVDAIEIKINLSRGDVLTRRNNKFLDDDRRVSVEESVEKGKSSPQSGETVACPSGNKCCRRRRSSMPDGFQSTKRTRKNDDERGLLYTAKKIKSKSRHKVRKSMDDELLLMNEERSRNETVGEERNFHVEMEKTFNATWARTEAPEIPDISGVTRDEEATKKEKKSAKSKTGSRGDKHARTVPSPSYNSLMENSSTLDFDNFDVAPHRSSDTDPEQGGCSVNDVARYGKGKWCHEDRDRYINPTNYGTSLDELASLDAFEINLNTVPIYTTKDGRITYSPNRNYTYRALIMEARQREGYPPLRKLHYPRHLPNNHYRENNQRKMYKKRNEEEKMEKKQRRGLDYYLGKSKRGETAVRGTRSKKHDNRRKESRIAMELECPASKSRSNEPISPFFKPESRETPPAIEPPSRIIPPNCAENSKHSTINQKDHCATKNVIDSLTSPQHFANDSIASKIFQNQQLEISARTVAANFEERLQKGRENCRRDSRFFQETPPTACSLVNLEKRPIGWDIEQDCQTVLSDSGLESSTTYVEASKESRRLERWKNSFVNKAETNRAIYSNTKDNGYEAIDISYDKSQEKASRYLDTQPKSLTIGEDEKEKELRVEAAINNTAANDEPLEAEIFAIKEKMDKLDSENPKSDLASLTNALETYRVSEIVKSLDLAITDRHYGVFKEARSETIIGEKEARVMGHGAAQIFQRDRNIKGRISDALPRRASSDEVDNGQPRILFFKSSKVLSEVEKTKLPEVQEEPPKDVLPEEQDEDTFDDRDTRMTMNETVEGAAVAIAAAIAETIEASCKDFLIDTSTSFSSCLKLGIGEPINEMPTVSEASRLDDTSTRFASESMDFKEIPETSNFQGNFTFSNSSVITGRDSFFSNITENAMTASESSLENSLRANDPLEKVPTLNFSGKIHDSRHEDHLSKSSPPCLINENSIHKHVIEKNESPESSPRDTRETSRESAEDKVKNPPEFDEEISSHPKIPKMIIRNVRSRPGTPTAAEEHEESRNSNKEEKVFEVEIKLEKREEYREECKVPKMKIKLEDKQLPRMVLESPKSLEIGSEASKNFPKMKIRKLRRSSTSRSPIRVEKLVGKLSRHSSETDMQLDFPESIDSSSSSYKFTLIEKSPLKAQKQSSRVDRPEEEIKQDRIPKLTIKKQEVPGSGYTSSSSAKKRRSRSPGESSSKKRKGMSRHSGNKKEEIRSQERRTNSLDNESNTDTQSLSEKVPKVIIKRTSPSAEFKCELSKVGREAITKDSKWQPEVKLQRSWVLDCMAKEPGSGKLALNMLKSSLDSKERLERTSRKNREWKRSVSDCDFEKSQLSELTVSNNRRRSLDELVADDRKVSREKDTCSESLGKSRTLPASIRVEQEQQEQEMENTKVESNPTRDKLDINESSKNTLASTKPYKNVGNDEENEGSVIKLDSSDESQTTIEILPASPDNELDIIEQTSEGIVCGGPMGKLYSDEAIPTQFELELEIVDNSTVDSLDVPMPMPGDASLEDDTTSTLDNLQRLERFEPCRVNPDDESIATDLGCEKFSHSLDARNSANSSFDPETGGKIICCSDSLVKEVLAAKETLKRCLTKSKSATRAKFNPRPKTAAEKKQGSGFHFVDLPEFAKTSKCDDEERPVFQADGKLCDNLVATVSIDNNTRVRVNDDRNLHNSQEKQDKYRKSWSNKNRSNQETVSYSKAWKRSAPSSTNVGGTKTSGTSMNKNEIYGENSKSKIAASGEGATRLENISSTKSTERINEPQQQQQRGSSPSKIKSYKIPKISQSKERNGGEDSAKEDKRKSPSPTIMPVLEPQVHLNFELAGSDRDTSRSPPVITKQEEHDIHTELPKKFEENLHSDKLDSITKPDTEAVTFADIVSQLAYHEKATIRHRRYCTLCERWFPTAARHRRHLTGYQHRHTELTQRRTVHALFMLFTGKPCPRLLPASIVRTDCLPGEPTPLQIAVQDVAISLEDGASVKPKDVNEKDD